MSLEELLRNERGPVLATLIRYVGDFTIAEDAVQEAVVVALRHWPQNGIPRNPGAWLTTTAKNRALDMLRRESSRTSKEREATLLSLSDAPNPSGAVADDTLRLLFTVCHPALPSEGQIALALRTLGGLTTEEIAAAFLVSVSTMGQRISRAKAKITTARIPYRVPDDFELPDRLDRVLTVVYSIFTAGHHASVGQRFDAKRSLCDEAIRLAELLVSLMPDEPECQGLLALLLATHARRDARIDDAGEQIMLANQDRSRWDKPMITRAARILESTLVQGKTRPFQLQAAIACAHSEALSFEATDWADIACLYQLLEQHLPTTVVKVNRAVAESFAHGPERGLAILDAISAAEVAHWFRYWATRAELLVRSGDTDGARQAWKVALGMDMNDSDRTAIHRRLDELPST